MSQFQIAREDYQGSFARDPKFARKLRHAISDRGEAVLVSLLRYLIEKILIKSLICHGAPLRDGLGQRFY